MFVSDSFARLIHPSMSLQSSISDETLFGYLLFALPDAEQWRIESLAFEDEALRKRIADLRDLLEPMREAPQQFEPCSDLTESTMAFIQQATQEENAAPHQATAGMSQPLFENNRATRLVWIDSLVALAAGITFLTILLPSVWYSRESARRSSCAANLRELGHALSLFAASNQDRQLPKIEADGPLCFAGVYAVRLKGAGLLESSKWIWCPALESMDVGQEVPSIQSFMAASPVIQDRWRFTAGGNISYNLGNIVDSDYETPRLSGTGRSHFPVLGDSILTIDSDGERGAVHGLAAAHASNVANVLYDDGRVQAVLYSQLNASSAIDNPYLNRDLQQAVGHGLGDSCLGPSFQNPFRPLSAE